MFAFKLYILGTSRCWQWFKCDYKQLRKSRSDVSPFHAVTSLHFGWHFVLF